MPASPLTKIAEQLLSLSQALDAYSEENGLPPASFERETFNDLPPEVEEQRQKVVDLGQDLRRLAQGPRALLLELGYQFNDIGSLHYMYHHKLPLHVPSEGAISYADLATASGTEERMTRRVVRMAMMHRIFAETPDGNVQHSAASRALHDEDGAMDAIGFLLEDLTPSSIRLVDSLNKYPGSQEPNETAFNLAFNTSRPIYLEMEADGERARRFGSTLRWFGKGGVWGGDMVARNYDWGQFDRKDALIVDVGGGQGAVARALANVTDSVRIVVQDLPGCAAQGEKVLPAELKGRVSFQGHDFFEKQPIEGADVYFLRWILHNWSDKYAARILKALLPALKSNSRILICEFLLPEHSELGWSKKQNYNMDLLSAIGWNSLERTIGDWELLFKSVDPKLKLVKTTALPGDTLIIIEARYG